MSKGRYAPPRPFVQITPLNPTVEEMLAAQTRPGVYMLELLHDDGCPTIRTQDERLCTCVSVDHVLLKYQAVTR